MENKTPNHGLSEMQCPMALADVDLFSPGAQEHWYEAYDILHEQAPVRILPGEGMGRGTDAFVLTKYADISRVVRDAERFRPTLSFAIDSIKGKSEAEAIANPQLNAMIVSMATLRPTPELWRAHRSRRAGQLGCGARGRRSVG